MARQKYTVWVPVSEKHAAFCSTDAEAGAIDKIIIVQSGLTKKSAHKVAMDIRRRFLKVFSKDS